MENSQDPHGPPPAEAANAETRLQGHLGHLTAQEESALTEFKTLAATAGFYKPATDKSQASHDDGTLVYAVPTLSLPITDLNQAGTYELGNSFLKTPLHSLKIRRSGARTMIWMLSTKR